MIGCLSCGRPLINGSPKEPTAAAELRAAMSLHNCPKGNPMTNPKDQCSRCDAVADLLEQNISTLEDCASVIGCPTPSLHVHLVQHDRDDLLRGLTYQGEPILEPKLEETTVVLHAVADDVVTGPQTSRPDDGPSCACDAYWFDEGETEFTDPDGIHHTVSECEPVVLEVTPEAVAEILTAAGWPEGTDPQELVDAGLVTPDEVELPNTSDLLGIVKDESGLPHELWDLRSDLDWLSKDHASEAVRTAAAGLASALDEWGKDRIDRDRLADLVEQRDALNAEIEALAQRLGDFPEPPPLANAGDLKVIPEPAPVKAKDGGSETALIREWARSQGRKVSPTGRLPRELVDAYREAMA